MAFYDGLLLIVGITVLAAAVLPRLLSDRPLSTPMIYVAAGMILFGVPLGVAPPDPVANPEVAERITELLVIIALMGAGLKLDRPFAIRAWSSTWRLLAVTMPITIVVTAVLGRLATGMLAATAVLLGAVVAPTDPVLASEVQASEPLEETGEEIDPREQEENVRFALTSEAGLNDGLAFPYTNLAIAMAASSGTAGVAWLGEWALVDVAYRIAVGVLGGYLGGKLLAILIFGEPAISELAKAMEGAEALAGTLITYGLTELLGGYGFIAVFVAAIYLRHYEWDHEYHVNLHDFAIMTERLLIAAVLVLFGGALVGGLLAPLTWTEIAVGLGIVLVVRPLAGVVGMVGSPLSWSERLIVATFGIRGVGSFFYLSHALNEAGFREFELVVAAEQLWALVGFVVLTSIVLHGITVTPAMNALELTKQEAELPEGAIDESP